MFYLVTVAMIYLALIAFGVHCLGYIVKALLDFINNFKK